MTTNPESARALLDRHGVPEDVIDGVLCLHAQELAAAIRAETERLKADGVLEPDKYRPCRDAADQIDPTCNAALAAVSVSVPPPATRAALHDHTAEAHRLALSEALGLGTGAPWDAIHERAAELAAPKPANRAAALSDAERTMLAYALDQAQEHIWSRDGFTDEDQAAVTSLRRLAAEAPTVTPPPALTEVGQLRAQVVVLQQDAERDRGLAKVGARCMRVGHQGLIEQGRIVLEGWRFALSTTLGLDAEASWEAIHERAKELRRMAAEEQPAPCGRPASLPGPCSAADWCCKGPGTAEQPATETGPDRCSGCRYVPCGHCADEEQQPAAADNEETRS